MNNKKNKSRIIITSCSKSKIDGKNMPAINLYDGPVFKILRKYNFAPDNLYIISAKYGVISGDTRISYYDQQMTIQRAMELSDSISNNLIDVVERNPDADILVNLGKNYANSIEGVIPILNDMNVTFASGKIGERLHQLKVWLEK